MLVRKIIRCSVPLRIALARLFRQHVDFRAWSSRSKPIVLRGGGARCSMTCTFRTRTLRSTLLIKDLYFVKKRKTPSTNDPSSRTLYY